MILQGVIWALQTQWMILSTLLVSKLAFKFATFINGMATGVAGALAGRVAGKSHQRRIDGVLHWAVGALMVGYVLVAIGYMIHSGYIDHVEPSIAVQGAIFRHGGDVYPQPGSHTLHGLLYGPGLTELQALFQASGLPIVMASKLPGLLALFVFCGVMASVLTHRLTRAYVFVMLMPFGIFLLWNRAEPLFLMLVALAIWLSNAAAVPKLWRAAMLGCLAGLASTLKLHGAMYVFAAVVASLPATRLDGRHMLLFAIGAVIPMAASFWPAPISIHNYFAFVALAGKHGISAYMAAVNGSYLALMLSPMLLLSLKAPSHGREHSVRIGLVIAVEVCSAIIGAKPGAGIHHLLPFLPINAYLLQRYFELQPGRSKWGPASLGGALLGMALLPSAWALFDLGRKLVNTFDDTSAARQELAQLSTQYPGLVLGITGSQGYEYYFLRPELEAKGMPQVDFTAFMDQNLSGVTDARFLQALQRCTFKYMALPIEGAPFSIANYYTGHPLLSDDVRQTFAKRYQLKASGRYLSVYACAL